MIPLKLSRVKHIHPRKRVLVGGLRSKAPAERHITAIFKQRKHGNGCLTTMTHDGVIYLRTTAPTMFPLDQFADIFHIVFLAGLLVSNKISLLIP